MITYELIYTDIIFESSRNWKLVTPEKGDGRALYCNSLFLIIMSFERAIEPLIEFSLGDENFPFE